MTTTIAIKGMKTDKTKTNNNIDTNKQNDLFVDIGVICLLVFTDPIFEVPLGVAGVAGVLPERLELRARSFRNDGIRLSDDIRLVRVCD